MKIQIICDCGKTKTFDETQSDDFWIRDTTPCSCGHCHGDEYEIDFGKCECGNKLIWKKEQ